MLPEQDKFDAIDEEHGMMIRAGAVRVCTHQIFARPDNYKFKAASAPPTLNFTCQ